MEQCQPLVESPQQNQYQQNQEQEGTHDFPGYTWQEHNYVSNGDGHSKMAFILVKQEVRVNFGSIKKIPLCVPCTNCFYHPFVGIEQRFFSAVFEARGRRV